MMKIIGKIGVVAVVFSFSLVGCNSSSGTGTTATATWQTVFSDDFNRADGSLGANYSVSNYCYTCPNIVTPAGMISISNNRVRLTGSDKYWIRYVTGVPNAVVRISVKSVTIPSSTSYYGVSVVARNRSSSSPDSQFFQEYYCGGLGQKGDTANSGNTDGGFNIWRLAGYYSGPAGVPLPAPLVYSNLTLKKGGSYLLELTVNGKLVTFVVTDLATNVSQTLSVTDPGSALSGDTVSINGFQTVGDTTYFDDFKIEKFE